MPIKIQTIDLDASRRVVCISDLHGHLDLFKQALQNIQFSKKDQLVILGDSIEKGPDSLGMIRYLMELQTKQEVYVVKGNCEDWVFVLLQDEQALYEYMQSRKESIFWEMAKELQIHPEHSAEFIHEIQLHFQKELHWMKSLPVIIDDPKITFVHAGIRKEKLDENQLEDCLTFPIFECNAPKLHKYVMVGHLPTVNYCHQYPNCNPRVNHETKIISIDGGMGVKPDGQLNVLLIDDLHTMKTSYCSLSEGKEMTVTKAQRASKYSYSITWLDNEIEVLDEDIDGYWIRHLSSDYQMHVAKDMIFDEGRRVYDVTDYHLAVNVNDKVYVYQETSKAYYAKKDGVLGWILK